MKLTPYKPFHTANFDRFFSDFFDRDLTNFFGGDHFASHPAVNVREEDDGYYMEFAAPGLTKDDFSIELKEGQLIVSAEQKMEKEQEADNYTRREFNFSSFKRVFTLPEAIEEEQVKANYEDGVLHIILPKKEMVVDKRRTIEIQ